MEITFNELAREIKKGSKNSINKALLGVGLEFGTITSTGLKLDTFKFEIKDYLVLEYLKLSQENFTSTNSGSSVKTPKELKPITPGDRVLVAAVGNEFVIVGRVI